ncbi:copper resistance CopC family protein [Sphaerisporangium dianthi]|uniref:Copper resistance protein CopC n=1 Tax=Sphaerisporangium dianthi TaxID=1436120 RepID=A0ABV9CBY5_9ACTN
MKSTVIRALLVLCVSAASLWLAAPSALAHDSLKSSSPAKNALVSKLDQIELEFSASVSFPAVILHDAAGRRFESGRPRTDGPKVFQKVAGPLPSGDYVVAWRIVSSDGHPVEGEIPFTVRASGEAAGTRASAAPARPAASAAASAPPPVSTSEDETSAAGVPPWIWAALGLLVVVAAAAVLTGRRTSRAEDDPSTTEKDQV